MPVFTNNTKIHHINVNQASFNIFQHSITLNTLQSFFLKITTRLAYIQPPTDAGNICVIKGALTSRGTY